MDTHPKEQFVFHAAGLGGRGSASYIDAVAFRDKDTTAWTANGRTPLDQRHYSLLNWRSDVVVIVTDTGTLVQHARYNDSGSPWGIPVGDVNGDGIVNTTDTGILLGAIGGAYVARYDLNLDGTVDAADHTIANNNLGDTLGHNALSLNPSSDVRGGHRLGYTGHTHADFNNALIVMRNRWYSGDLGRFVSRDPMGFVDGANVYAYARGNGVSGRDPMGLCGQAMCNSNAVRQGQRRIGQLPPIGVPPVPGVPEVIPMLPFEHGPPTVHQFHCIRACDGATLNGLKPDGVNVCIDGQLVICLCPQNFHGDDEFRRQYINCVTAHERINANALLCDPNCPGLCSPNPDPNQPFQDCVEALAYDAELTCLGHITCTTPECREALCIARAESACRFGVFQTLCQLALLVGQPVPIDIMAALENCKVVAENACDQ